MDDRIDCGAESHRRRNDLVPLLQPDSQHAEVQRRRARVDRHGMRCAFVTRDVPLELSHLGAGS